MITPLLSIAQGAATSAEFTVPAGVVDRVFLVDADGDGVPFRSEATVQRKGSGNQFQSEAWLDFWHPSAEIQGPGTFRVVRGAGVAVGVDRDNGTSSALLVGANGLTLGGQALTASQKAQARAGLIGPIFSNTVAIIGDSIAAAGWFWLLATLSATRMRVIKNAGVGGNTSAQMRARIQADVLSLRPTWTAIQGVTPNDHAQGLTVAQTVENVKAMCADSIAAGSSPIIILGPPNNVTARNDHLRLASLLLAEWANSNNIPTFDIYTPLADPATGVYLAAYQTDGTHPSRAGERAMADVNVPVVAEIFKPFSLQQTRIGDVSNLFVNGLFLSDSNTDGLADSLTKSGAGVASLVATGANGFGNWQVCAPGGADTQIFQDVTTVVGRTYEASAGVYCTGAATIRFRLPGADYPASHGAFGPIDVTAGAVVTARFIATTTSSRINLGANGASGEVGYRQVTVRDITTITA